MFPCVSSAFVTRAGLLTAALTLFTACDFLSRKVSGTISIKASATENARLVLVPVHLVPQNELVQIFSEVLPGYESERNEAMSRARTLHDCRKPLEGLAAELTKLRDQVKGDASYGKLLDAALDEVTRARTDVTLKQETLAAIYSEHQTRTLWERITPRLPPPASNTDSDGRFLITVPDDGEWMVVADATQGGRHHRWCAPLAGAKRGTTALELANDNVVDDSQIESFLRKLANLKPAARPAAKEVPVVKETQEWATERKEKLTRALADLQSRAKKDAAAASTTQNAAQVAAMEEKRKMDEIAKVEKQRRDAELALEMKRAFVAESRIKSVGTKHEIIVLKSNKKLENVTIKAFNDDGISFTSEGGAARVLWADLPESWVDKYRDPPTAQVAAEKAAQEAEVLAEVEAAGHEVELSFVKELGNEKDGAGLRGSIVKALGARHGNDWKAIAGRQIFVLGMGKASFENSRTTKVRLYPTGRRTTPSEGSAFPLYVGSAIQALQLARESGLGLSEISKDEL